MAITVSCESCGVSYRVDDSAAGKSGKCKQCGSILRVPAAAPPPLTKPSPVLAPPQIVPIPAQPIGYPPTVHTGVPQSPQMISSGSGPNWKLIIGIVALVLLVVGGGIWVVTRAVTAVKTAASNAFNNAVANAGTVNNISPAMFPPRPGFRQLQNGVQFSEVRTGMGGNAGLKLWIYLPGDSSTRHAPQSLPCVFIAPAGGNLTTGMDLTGDDRPEHLPYVKAGFAVVAFALDGWLDDRKNPSDDQAATAMRLFMASDAGVANGKKAIDYATAKFPEIDPARLYTAGHSSAGTLSLLMASHESRLRGSLAYAPCVDIERFHGKQAVAELDRGMPGMAAFLRRTSPAYAPPPMCPVFLFHADDDLTVPIAQVRAYASQHPTVTLSTVPTGGHADAMTQSGIGRGIEWMKQNGAKPWERSSQASTARPDPRPTPPRSSTVENTPIKRPDVVTPPPTTPRPQPSPKPEPKPATVPVLPDLGALEADPASAALLATRLNFGPFAIAIPDGTSTPMKDVVIANGRANLPVFVAKHQMTVIFQIEPRIDRDVDKPAVSAASAPPKGSQKLWSPRATSGGYGTINGRTFARLERTLGGTRTQIQYAAFVDNHYVTIQVHFPTGNEEARKLGEAIARSMR